MQYNIIKYNNNYEKLYDLKSYFQNFKIGRQNLNIRLFLGECINNEYNTNMFLEINES